MQVEIYTPEKKLYSGEAISILLPGAEGRFEILNNHAPIIASLTKGNIEIKTENENFLLEVEDGFVECVKNQINVIVSGGSVVE